MPYRVLSPGPARARALRAALLCITLPLAAGCTEISDTGELVRHEFGYVKITTPAVYAPNAAVRVIEVETYGLWVDIDERPAGHESAGNGFGLGYRDTRREFIPLDCRVVIRVPDKQALATIVEGLNEEAKRTGGICVIQDGSLAAE